jgi:hypothetical protein
VLLNSPERSENAARVEGRSERLQAVPEDLLKANRRVIFSGVLSNERMRYPQKAELFGTQEIFDFLVHQEQESRGTIFFYFF